MSDPSVSGENPIDQEVYGEGRSGDPQAIKQGNPGRRQSELGPFDDEGDAGDGPSTGATAAPASDRAD